MRERQYNNVSEISCKSKPSTAKRPRYFSCKVKNGRIRTVNVKSVYIFNGEQISYFARSFFGIWIKPFIVNKYCEAIGYTAGGLFEELSCYGRKETSDKRRLVKDIEGRTGVRAKDTSWRY